MGSAIYGGSLIFGDPQRATYNLGFGVWVVGTKAENNSKP